MWHYSEGGKAVGPVTEEVAADLVRRGVIGPDTLVWQESMPDWQAARTTTLYGDPGAPRPPDLPASASTSEDRTLGVLSHVLGLLTGFLGPLIILLTVDKPEVKRHAAAALNWQISLIIYLLASFVLMFVLVGMLVMPVLILLDLVFCIMAAVKAGDGTVWKYPLSIPFVRS